MQNTVLNLTMEKMWQRFQKAFKFYFTILISININLATTTNNYIKSTI